MSAVASDWRGLPVVVAGAGLSGTAAARALHARGARVTVADASEERAEPLRAEGLTVTDLDAPPAGTGLVVASPGWRPTSPLLVAAQAAGVEVVGEVELAWRLRRPGAAAWLTLTGTNGKTTTVKMLEAVLGAAGLRTVAAGNVGLPLLEAVDDPAGGPYDVLAVELSSFQLHGSSTLRPHAAALLNLADDHTDWHGSYAAYVAAKAKVWSGGTSIGNVDDDEVRGLLARSPGRQVGTTTRVPAQGQLGLVEHLLVDRAFHHEPSGDVAGEATELASLADLTVPGAHNVANALAAAALARAYGVPAGAVRAGLAAFRPEPHRNALVATLGGVAWVDDSKATNPHAAAASLATYDPLVWVAGGLLKGADVDALVRDAAPHLRAVVLLGTDRAVLAQALARHAPEVPVVEVARLDTGAMSEVVDAAARLAQPGDTVLLAPAAASMDCFRDYNQRGELFAELVRGAGMTAVLGLPLVTGPSGALRPPEAKVPVLQRPMASYYLLLASVGLLLVIGLVMVFSASSVRAYATYGSSSAIAVKQAVYIGLGLPCMLAASRLPVRFWRAAGTPLLLAAIGLLVLVLVPGVGRNIDGATRWIPLPGGFNLQPSELAKLSIALWGADLLVRKKKLLGEWKHLMVPLLPVSGFVCALIMLEPDMGTTMATITVVVALLWVVGTPLRHFGLFFAVLLSGAAVLAISEPYRLERVLSFADPFADPQGNGYQAVQGLYALSAGGWFGVGLGASEQKWSGGLPNAHTDFVFAIIGEELGLLGTFTVLLLVATLAYAGVRIAQRADDPFVRLASSAVTAWLVGQSVINIGAVVGLVPITGIPLPFVSYGGSAMVPTLVAVGMLLSFARAEPGAEEALAARRRRAGAARRAAGSVRLPTVPGSRGPSARTSGSRPASAGPRRTVSKVR